MPDVRNREAEQDMNQEARMAINTDALEIEALYWRPTGEMRWFRPPGASDHEKELQVLWERVTGERAWRTVPTCLAD